MNVDQIVEIGQTFKQRKRAFMSMITVVIMNWKMKS